MKTKTLIYDYYKPDVVLKRMVDILYQPLTYLYIKGVKYQLLEALCCDEFDVEGWLVRKIFVQEF